MGIRIESISVRGLGPIASLDWKFGDINLVYGKNEHGKTYLVEYILRSLFKSPPATRDLTESGQVIVSGIGAGSSSFNLRTREKLDQLLFPAGSGLQADLARLCVVKAGQLGMAGSGMISRAVLKDYLSDQRVYDAIMKKIPSTTQGSRWEGGEVISQRKMGDLKTLAEKQQELKDLDILLQVVDSSYSQGTLNKASMTLQQTLEVIQLQETARRIYAGQLAARVRETGQQLAAIPEKTLADARFSRAQVISLQGSQERLQSETGTLREKSRDYLWLKNAVIEIENRPEGLKTASSPLLMILAAAGVLLSVLFAFFKLPLVSLLLGIGAVVLMYFFIQQLQAGMQSLVQRSEVDDIFKEYDQKFPGGTRSIAALKSKLDELAAVYFRLDAAEKQLEEFSMKLETETNQLNTLLRQLEGKAAGRDDPDAVISRAAAKRNQLAEELKTLELELAGIPVPAEDYLPGEAGVQYDARLLRSLEAEQQKLEKTIQDEKTLLDTLKQRICTVTHDEITCGWEDLIGNLRGKRAAVSAEYKRIKADVGAGILLTGVITELRAKEDENIQASLSSKTICGPIAALTHAYKGVELSGDEIVVFDEIKRFPLSTLSTGAQDQVLLALRLGIAEHLLGDQKFFFILDDAFQHSDWERREWMVDKMAELASLGWQIIYFSMDDHIRMLFEKRVKPGFQERYRLLEL